nr:hypothetical protein [Tanacetum cinerariifolium]
RYRITCTGPSSCKGGSVDVTIVDLCPDVQQMDLIFP